jgi:triosephosphate isomerase (TIM)
MSGPITPVIAGNWKMNGLRASLSEISALVKFAGRTGTPAADILVCMPATLISEAAQIAKGSRVRIGAQDCHLWTSGAHTGDISAEMLEDSGATHVIVGHSERRTDHHETDRNVRGKAEAAIKAGLVPIICVGETREERQSGQALSVVSTQLAGSIPAAAEVAPVVVAYEPVWAIGTGLTPTSKDIVEIHAAIRAQLTERFPGTGGAVPILYGGSMKPDNAREILSLPEVNGGLVGGASLKADDFITIIDAASTMQN